MKAKTRRTEIKIETHEIKIIRLRNIRSADTGLQATKLLPWSEPEQLEQHKQKEKDNDNKTK